MPWVESHTVLGRHRKVLLLTHDLKISIAQAVGHLHLLWHTILEQQEDGDLAEWPDAMIEEAASWEGAPGEFIARLRQRGWLDGHLVHDWLDYVGPYLTRKYHSENTDLLKTIWAKHGYKYGEGKGKYAKQKGSDKEAKRKRKVGIPNPSPPNPSGPDLTEPTEDADALARFDEFWKIYPAREGKKLEKAETSKRFLALSMEDQILAVQAARNYAESINRSGINPRDPKRFLRDGKGCEVWRDWIEPAKPDVHVKPKQDDPIPKAFAVLPRSTVQGTPMPEDFSELIKRVGKEMPSI